MVYGCIYVLAQCMLLLVTVWNSLPNDVVAADNINLLKKRLDKFWSSYDFVYLFRAQTLGTGSVKYFRYRVYVSFVYLNY